ncbi:unnamed protein product, partial [Thlaspi arvense]
MFIIRTFCSGENCLLMKRSECGSFPRKPEAKVSEETIDDGIEGANIFKEGPISKSSGLLSRSGLLPKSGPLPKTTGPFSDESGIKSASPSSSSTYHFYGLTRSLWSRTDRTTHVPCDTSQL